MAAKFKRSKSEIKKTANFKIAKPKSKFDAFKYTFTALQIINYLTKYRLSSNLCQTKTEKK